ncbi:hypothetical protein LX86_002251 [Lentzea aerocolonigenes]|nr:hypothetical protein [Lentzea aerocolonigenes]
MLVKHQVPWNEYYNEEGSGAELVDVYEFRADGRVIAQRLDALGITADTVAELLEYFLHGEGRHRHSSNLPSGLSDEYRARLEAEDAALDQLTPQLWLDRAIAAKEDQGMDHSDHDRPPSTFRSEIGSIDWLLGQVVEWFPPHALRAVLLVYPDSEVRLDVTDLVEEDWIYGDPDTLASQSLSALQANSGSHAPVIVLTEGRTDAEFLAASLELLFPHLTDLIKFLDYDARPEGGAGALARLVKSFAAAGIANRVVAIFDNDSAAVDAMQPLTKFKLPANIVVTQYPNLDELRRYPTLGPPTAEHPNGTQELADINGLAGSIELYLGRDVLTDATGNLLPVQWRSFIQSISRYQGEVSDKHGIQKSFRAKLAKCRANPEEVKHSDWTGMRHILTVLLQAFPQHSDLPQEM